MSLLIPVILVGSAIILAVLLLLLWPLDKEFFGKWGRRMAISYGISLVAISAPTLWDYQTGCSSGRYDGGSCAIGAVFVGPGVVISATLLSLVLIAALRIALWAWQGVKAARRKLES